jgi:hypothetical protein
VGDAVAAILSLPIKPEADNKNACLEALKNKIVYVNSFTLTQKDLFQSVLRVTGTKESDWSVTQEPSQQRYRDGLKQTQDGHSDGFIAAMYSRVFFPDGSGDVESTKGTVNGLLGLANDEDIDQATHAAIKRAKLLYADKPNE